MSKFYLNEVGLARLWERIKTVFTVKADSIKNITRSGTTFTATRADGTEFQFTQQDNNTWNAMKGATASANGTVGYVNAVPPQDGYNTKYLRADGTWAIPTGADAIAEMAVLVISIPEFSALPVTVQNSEITYDMVSVKEELSNPSAQTSDWTVGTVNGSVTVSGSINGTTSLTLYLSKSR